MVVDRSNVDHIMRGLQSTEGVRLHNHRKKLRQRFDIIKKLGQGTYGKVQLGINKETGQEVAIKTIKKCKIETDADLVRIRREIQIMSSVRHPNIIHIYEVFENREKIVLVMEYAAGGELYDYLSERKVLEETEARRIFRQVSTAIYYCHKHKICHRDLKLENILLDEHGSAKIADFGLSNVFDGQRLLSTYCGSPLYASPEIVKGTPYHGPEVDCWSLGVLLYTLVYGAMPFDGSNFKRLVKQISQGDYFEPKKASSASPLIRDMLTVNSPDRATIEQICSHWWVNQGFNVSCLDIAEDLANQTPVRLDLLLSLAPPPENAEKIVVTDDQRAVPQEGPPRSMSVGSFMDLDANAEERVRSFVAREVPSEPSSNEKTMKRKLEPVPSKSFSGARKKERTKPDGEEEASEEPVPDKTDPSAKPQVESNNTVMDVDRESNKSEEQIKKQEESAKEESKSAEVAKEVAEKRPEKVESSPESAKPATEVASAKDKPTRKSVKVVKKKPVEKKDSDGDGKQVESPSAEEKTAKVKKKKTESPVAEEKVTEVTKPVVKDQEEKSRESVTVEKAPPKQEPASKSPEKAKPAADREEKEKTPTPSKPVERRKSKIFETAEKFMAAEVQKSPTQDKAKKVYIPGVKVSDFAKAFERKSSIPTATTPARPSVSPTKKIVSKESSPTKKVASKESSPKKADSVRSSTEREEEKKAKTKSESPDDKRTEIQSSQRGEDKEDVRPRAEDGPKDASPEKVEKEKAPTQQQQQQPVPVTDDKLSKLKNSARNVISSALVEDERKKLKKQVLKPPVPRTKTEDLDTKKKNLTLQIGKETATVQVHTPENNKFFFEPENDAAVDNKENVEKPKEKKTAKLEITLKSNTLPRRTSKAEVHLTSPQVQPTKEPANFRTEVEHRVGDPSHVYSTQRSEVAFPVSAATKPIRSMSLEPEGKTKQVPVRTSTRERIIPIEFEGRGPKEETEARDRVQELDKPHEARQKHPYQRTWSLKSNSLSRQNTQDSDTESIMSTTGEPIKKSPREFIIPIAVEGGGYVTPRATSLEPSESMTKRNHRPFSRKFSLWSDNGSEDESPFSTLQRHSSRDLDEPFRLHRLRSSRPTRQSAEKGDSASGSEEEEEDDDGFELLTAENLFSTLLSRVRSLTQRLNVEDGLRPGFPSTRLLANHFGPSERLFSNLHQPMTRLSDRSDFGRSLSRDMENGANWSRGDVRNSESNRSVPRGNSKSKRSDSDTESLSEAAPSSGQPRKQRSKEGESKKHHHHQHHHSRTKSAPLNLSEPSEPEYGSGPEPNKAVYMPSRMWTARAYDRGSVEREFPSGCRSAIPKLLRPTSLLLERRQSLRDADEAGNGPEKDPAAPRERDFYDILAEKYGITNVKRYDLQPERRTWRGGPGYQGEKRRPSGSAERPEDEENMRPEENRPGDEAQRRDSTPSRTKKEAPSEKLAAVLSRLESRGQDRGSSGRRESAPCHESTPEKGRTESRRPSNSGDGDRGTSRIPKKVAVRHISDLTQRELDNLRRREDGVSPEKSPNRYARHYSVEPTVEPGRTVRRGPGKERRPAENAADDSGRSPFLTSLESKLDKLRTATTEKKYVDKAIRSLRESSLGPTDVFSENVLIKRAVSLSDCPSGRKSSRGRTPTSNVNSVSGLLNKFENVEGRNSSGRQDRQDAGDDRTRIPVFKRGDAETKPEYPDGDGASTYPRRPSYFTGNGYPCPRVNCPDDSGQFLSPDCDSVDSWSICSDYGTPDEVISRTHPARYGVADDVTKESVSDRIRRKSFYTRFNERKKPRRSSLLSRSYDPDLFDGEQTFSRSMSVAPCETYQRPRPEYHRSVSSGDERTGKGGVVGYDGPRPRPFYNAQVTDSGGGGGTAAGIPVRRDSSEWQRQGSFLRSGSQSPSAYTSLTLPRNFSTFDPTGRQHRAKSTFNARTSGDERPFSPGRAVTPVTRGTTPDERE